MTPSHAGRVAVVTGAASGIGRALCVALAEHGATVVGVDRADLSETGRLVGTRWSERQLDITDAEAVAALPDDIGDEVGAVQVLVNCAGIDDALSWDELDHATWSRVLRVDLEAPFLLSKAFTPGMRALGWGRILNFGSEVVLSSFPTMVTYRAAKMGLIGLTRGLAVELGRFGITANVISPGLTRTPMSLATVGAEVLEQAASSRSVPKVAVPEDLVGTALFLTSDASAFVTGQTLLVSGGDQFN